KTHVESADFLPHRFVPQRSQKGLHRRTLPTVFAQQKIIFLGCNRQKSKPIETRHRLDGDTPVGPALRHRSSDRIMRARLVAVTGGPPIAEQSINQKTRAGSGISVDHDDTRICSRGLYCSLGVRVRETSIVGAINKSLHALPTLDQGEPPLVQQMSVVDSGLRIEEVHGSKVALATLDCGDATDAAYRKAARADALRRKRAEHDIKCDVMAAYQHKRGQLCRRA